MSTQDKNNPPKTFFPWEAKWSNSKAAWYYVNSKTNKSQWILPVEENPENKMDDINSVKRSNDDGNVSESKRFHNNDHNRQRNYKFEKKSGDIYHSNATQRYKEIVAFANTVLSQSEDIRNSDKPKELFENSHMEIARNQEMAWLRKQLHHHCHIGKVRLPSGALERWCFAQGLLNPGEHILLPSKIAFDSGLYHELKRFKHAREPAVREIVNSLAKDGHESIERLSKYKDIAVNLDVLAAELEENEDFVNVKCGETVLKLNKAHVERLKRRYSEAGSDPALFSDRLFRLACRYDALGGAGYQGALPESGFDILTKYLKVNHECFASPFNAYLPCYNSAFLDTDKWFGSKGSFLETDFSEGGYFEANPPFVEETMQCLAVRAEQILSTVEKPVTFVIIVPAWSDTPSYDINHHSKYLKKEMKFNKHEHTYKEGYQHRTAQQYRKSEAGTFIFVLQNDAAAQESPVTEEFVKEFSDNFVEPEKREQL